MKRLHVIVHGKVQGVFYREFVRKNADALCLNGYVRNRDDGKVEAEFEGDFKNLQRILELLKVGPSTSVVEKVEPKWLPYKDEFSSFVVW